MPDPILTAIATSLVTKAAGGLFDLVKAQFAKRAGKDVTALEDAVAAGPRTADVQGLAELLAEAEGADQDFASALRGAWARISIEQRVEHGGVSNQITGTVTGNVVQARDIQGGISFGS
ncbi:MAG TPA: hypothetical protein VHX38_37055 [Pseudonocardiaceae bacterium]|jgi:hypothetical protein|nr:hypothetical protein [Pseudonocardiaceae bacterium]